MKMVVQVQESGFNQNGLFWDWLGAADDDNHGDDVYVDNDQDDDDGGGGGVKLHSKWGCQRLPNWL